MITHYLHVYNNNNKAEVLSRARYIDECNTMIKEGLIKIIKVSDRESLMQIIDDLTNSSDNLVLKIYNNI